MKLKIISLYTWAADDIVQLALNWDNIFYSQKQYKFVTHVMYSCHLMSALLRIGPVIRYDNLDYKRHNWFIHSLQLWPFFKAQKVSGTMPLIKCFMKNPLSIIAIAFSYQYELIIE